MLWTLCGHHPPLNQNLSAWHRIHRHPSLLVPLSALCCFRSHTFPSFLKCIFHSALQYTQAESRDQGGWGRIVSSTNSAHWAKNPNEDLHMYNQLHIKSSTQSETLIKKKSRLLYHTCLCRLSSLSVECLEARAEPVEAAMSCSSLISCLADNCPWMIETVCFLRRRWYLKNWMFQ